MKLIASVLALLFLAPAGLRATEPGAQLSNGDFSAADPRDATKPMGWGRVDGLGVQWSSADAAHGRAIRMDTRLSEKAMMAQWTKVGLTNEWFIPKPDDGPIAATYGLSLYSESIAVKAGQAYRVTFDFKGPAGGAKVWVRGWGLVQGEKRRRWETVVNCRSQGEGWTPQSQVFHPTRARPGVTEMKVMLFAHHPPAVYWFDNIRIEPVAEPSTTPATP